MKKVFGLITSITLLSLLLTNNLKAQQFTESNLKIPALAWGESVFADYNKDGKPDLLMVGRDKNEQAVTRLCNYTEMGFVDSGIKLPGLLLSSAQWVDFNTDSYPDIIIMGRNNDGKAQTLIYINNTGLSFDLELELTGLYSGSVSSTDMNGDNKPDIFITGKNNSGAAQSILYQNTGNFTFTEVKTDMIATYSGDTEWCDFNNDGYPELIITGDNGMNRYTRIYKNNKDNTFTSLALKLENVGNSAISCADYDNDGLKDLVVTGLDIYGSEVSRIYHNEGDLWFVDYNKTRGLKPMEKMITPIAYGDVKWIDLDNDKDQDIIISGKASKKITEVYLNEGDAGFIKSSVKMLGVYHSSIAIADLDNDKIPDIVVSGLTESRKIESQFYINKGKIKQKEPEKVEKKIKPDFVATLVNEGKETTFINKTSSEINKPLTYSWDFGDGTSSNMQNPKHKYAKQGRYTVTLTVQSDNIIETKIKQIVVRPKNLKIDLFTDKEKIKIHTEAIEVVREYENLINKLGKTSNSEEDLRADLKESIINLFLTRRILVHNDLDPEKKTSKLLEIETYATDLILWYPDGISVTLDLNNSRVGAIKQLPQNLYSMDIIVTKQTTGNYMNRSDNMDVTSLSFRVAFSKKGNNFTNFKIVGIRDAFSLEPVQDVNALAEVNKAELDAKQIEQIHQNTKSIIFDYERNLKFLGNPKEDEEDKEMYEMAFVELFKDSTSRIFNDIEPENTETQFLASNYLQKYRTLYASGIDNLAFDLDSADYRPPIKDDDNNELYVNVYVDKNFSGKINNKNKHKSSDNLVFKIVFKQEGNSFVDFKTAGIDQSALGFYQSSDQITEMDTTTYQIKLFSQKGSSIGFYAGGGYGGIYDQNMIEQNMDLNYHEWKFTPNYVISVGFDYNYFFNDKIGIRTGIGASYYQANYNLTGEFQEDKQSIDGNETTFYKIVDAQYDTTTTIVNVDIPVQFQWLFGKPRKFGFYIEAGANLSLIAYNQANVKGNYKYYGYYPTEPESLRYLDFESLGFSTQENLNYSTKAETNIYSVSLIASVGVTIPLGYFSTIKLGPEILYGLTDLNNAKNYYDIFGNSQEKLPTSYRYYGFKLSINYKL